MALEPVGCILLGSGVDLSVSQSRDRSVCVSPAPWHRGVVGSHPAAAPRSGEKGCGGDARACLGTWGPSPRPPLKARGGSWWVRPSYRRCRGRGRARQPPAAGPGGAAPGPWAQRPVLPPAASGGGRGKGKKGKKGKKGGDATPRPPPRGQPQPTACPKRPQCTHSWDMGKKGEGFFQQGAPTAAPTAILGCPQPQPCPSAPTTSRELGHSSSIQQASWGGSGGPCSSRPPPIFARPLPGAGENTPG